MEGVTLKIDASGLLDYSKRGKEAFKKVRKAMMKVGNAGRTEARRRIASQFGSRTGRLRAKGRSLRVRATVKSFEVSVKVSHIRFANLYEHGVTLARGRGFLRARPIVNPGREKMQTTANVELRKVLGEASK